MKAAIIVAAVLIAIPALAADKKCAALNADGSVIAEFDYVTGKYGECSDKVKTEAAKALCKPGDKKAKFQFRKDSAEKPRDSFANCKLAGAPAEAKAEPAKAEPAKAEEKAEEKAAKPAAGKMDAKCMIACNATYKTCTCAKADVPCVNACSKTFSDCNKGCGWTPPGK
ncbi:MAG: hypothetical protein ACYC8T_15820 [Myxococcaceae bacterium]